MPSVVEASRALFLTAGHSHLTSNVTSAESITSVIWRPNIGPLLACLRSSAVTVSGCLILGKVGAGGPTAPSVLQVHESAHLQEFPRAVHVECTTMSLGPVGPPGPTL
jgi:hypothetical protein